MNIPSPGTIIRTNYGEGKQYGYCIKRVFRCSDGSYSFACCRADDQSGQYYLNDYRLINGRLLGRQQLPGTAGYLSNGGGRDGDGYDEITIETPALQPSLFV